MSDRTYISGNYEKQNTEHDALLLASCLGETTFYQTSRFIVESSHALTLPYIGQIPSILAPQREVNGSNRVGRLSACMSATRILLVGPTLGTDKDIRLKALMAGVVGRTSAIGIGIEPFKSHAEEVACKELLRRCDIIGTRDRQSYDIAKSLVADDKVHQTFDIVPSMLTTANLNMPEIDRRGVAVIIDPDEFRTDELGRSKHWIKQLARSLTTISEQTGESVALIGFSGAHEKGDGWYQQTLLDELPNKMPKIVIAYQPDPLMVLMHLANFRAVISMRLHGSIMSYLAKTPVISVSDKYKCEAWCDQIRMPERYQFSKSGLDSDQLSSVIIQGLEHGFDVPTLPVHAAVTSSLRNWNLLWRT